MHEARTPFLLAIMRIASVVFWGLAIAHGGCSPVSGSVQQHYYVTRASRPHIATQPAEPACSPAGSYPAPYCPTGNDVTLDMFNWTSAEVKAGVAVPAAGVVAAYDCVSYAVCGYRIYSDADQQQQQQHPLSDPEQFTVVRSSVPLLQQPLDANSTPTCTSYPSAADLCPIGRERRSVYNITSQEVVGLVASSSHNGSTVVLGQYECVTYAICGYRIFTESASAVGRHKRGNGAVAAVERRRLQSPVPQQFISVRISVPLVSVPSTAAGSRGAPQCVWRPPVDCTQMHFYLSQTNHSFPQLKAAALVVKQNAVVGLFDCVTESLCGYANPPPTRIKMDDVNSQAAAFHPVGASICSLCVNVIR